MKTTEVYLDGNTDILRMFVMMDQKKEIHAGPKSQLRLPFREKKKDAGSWAYDHRTGILAMICVYLLLGIIFVGSKIVMGRSGMTQSIVIDIQNADMLQKERDRLLEEVRKKNSNVDWSAVRNVSSNENALNEKLDDAKGTDVRALNEEARRVAESMQSNRSSYEDAVDVMNASIEQQRNALKSDQTKKTERKR